MNPLDRLEAFLKEAERRLRFSAFWRGAALLTAAALIITVALVVIANGFAFAESGVLGARVLLFLSLALIAAFGLLVPLLRLNRVKAARKAEERYPELQERLLTLAEMRRGRGEEDAFAELLAADTVEIVDRDPERANGSRRTVFGFIAATAASIGALAWLIVSGPGFLGYGAALLWAGPTRELAKPFYQVLVEPGDRTVRRKTDQLITAKLVGFESQRVRLMARYESATKWEEAAMQPQPGATGFEFLLAGIPEKLTYYVEAGGVRSTTHTITVVDLPEVKKIRVRYRYPKWTGMADEVEDPGGDLRAVEGTQAEVQVETDKPLAGGVLVLNDGAKIELQGEGNTRTANVPIQREGAYHIAAVEGQETVRLTEDYFIEVQKDGEPEVQITRPGRDARVSPIEEVRIQASASDDFGLAGLELHYSVNAGPEKTVSLLKRKGEKETEGATVLYLEDFKLRPGDVVSMYATARDARNSAKTDIYFLQAEPFEREYSQSQQAGGGGGGGEGEQDNRISERQKEIIAATWNQIKGKGERAAAAENAKFLSDMQAKLRDQARSLARRMASRQLSGANESFKNFSQDMEQAAVAMDAAAGKLKGLAWDDALQPEQKALQHLLRAESTFRQIQVAFGSRGGGGGGGGGMGRDLENLFDLELDTEKNQYETGRQTASNRQKEIDEALQKLEELARRQQQLSAQQQQNRQQSFQQRWQQEILRREAEQLQRRMEQLSRGGQQQQQGGQQQAGQQQQQGGQQQAGQQQQQGGQQQGGQQQGGQQQGGQQQASSGRQSGSQARGGRSGGDPRLEQALQRLQQATEDMRQAGQGTGAEARRAAERLEDARRMLRGVQQQGAEQNMENLVRQAEQLAEQQRSFENRLRQAYQGQTAQMPPEFGRQGRRGRSMPDEGIGSQRGMSREQAEKLAAEREQMLKDLETLEGGMRDASRNLAGGQRAASSKVREALGEMQQNELRARMRYNADLIRRGLGAFSVMREAPITRGTDQLAEQLRGAQQAVNRGAPGDRESAGRQEQMAKALAQMEQLRQRLEGQRGQQQGGQQQGGQQAGQRGGGNQQGGGQRADGFRRQQGGGDGGGSYSAMNRGDLEAEPQAATAAGVDRAFRETLGELGEVRQQVAGDTEMSEDIRELMRELRAIDPNRFRGNPALLERIHNELVLAVEEVELRLRRKLGEGQQGQVRTVGPERVPAGYAEAVAEYFRRLSKQAQAK